MKSVDNYTPALHKDDCGVLAVGQDLMNAMVLNERAMRTGWEDGTLPRYPEFVDNLFKQMPMFWTADVLRVIDDEVKRLADAGQPPLLQGFALKNRLAGMVDATGSAMHAAIGCAGEGGELLDAVKKAFVYRKDWYAKDKTGQSPIENVLEELGDWRFYYQCFLNLLGITDQDVMAHNYAKLRQRYSSGKYSDAQAQARADKPVHRMPTSLDPAFGAVPDLLPVPAEPGLKQDLANLHNVAIMAAQEVIGELKPATYKQPTGHHSDWTPAQRVAIDAAIADGTIKPGQTFTVEPVAEYKVTGVTIESADGAVYLGDGKVQLRDMTVDEQCTAECCGDAAIVLLPEPDNQALTDAFVDMAQQRGQFMHREAQWVQRRAELLQRASAMLDKLPVEQQDKLIADGHGQAKWGLDF